MVRNKIAQYLEEKKHRSPSRAIALNLAFCSAIGFGTGRDDEKSKSILLENDNPNEDLGQKLRYVAQISGLENDYREETYGAVREQGYTFDVDIIEAPH